MVNVSAFIAIAVWCYCIMITTERAINERRQWKAEVFPYDVFIPDGSRECQYCLTENQAMLLRGLLQPVAWRTRWYSDTQEVVQDEIEAFRDDIIRRLMMSCCGGDFQIIFQWTEDGILQQSEDGGETWEDAPQEDPRNSSPVYPPVPGEPSDDKKCIAATSITTLFKEQVGDQLTDDMSRYTLAQLVHDWVTTYLQTSNPFEALIQIAANQIFALVIATLRTALTTEVYDQLTCILYCRMASDISFNESRWELVRSDILAQISGIAGIFLEHLVFLLGRVGLTNLARSQAATTGDCSDCDCPSTCDPDGWINGVWYLGVDYNARGGTIVETGLDYVIIESFDRGDGQDEIAFYVRDHVTCCDIDIAWVNSEGTEGSYGPEHVLKWSSPCPQDAAYEDMIRNDLMAFPQSMTGFYFQLDPGTWRLKVKFV